jgi:hypothetical protein
MVEAGLAGPGAAARHPGGAWLQAQLRVGAVNDPLEREADRVAEAVLGDKPAAALGAAPPALQRQCASCAADEDAVVQRKCAACAAEEETAQQSSAAVSAGRVASGGAGAHAASHDGAEGAARAVALGGAPLSRDLRAYFEPRFGRDLSTVRLHTGPVAAAAAERIDARAFTLGRNIGFARGEYAPDTGTGRRLIAHELAHVVQQSHEPASVVRRITYGRRTPPEDGWQVVPANEHAHVDEAIALVDDVVDNPNKYSECHDHFAHECPGGTAQTLATVWGRAVLWKIAGPDPGTLARGDVSGSNLAYTQEGYDQNASALAMTLMHEAGHNCGIPGGAPHWRADKIAAYCMGPQGQNALALQVGGRPGGSVAPLYILSYRRFLGDWASGRLRATLGADFDVVATLPELKPLGQRPPGEFGSVMGGLQARLGGWGGSRYGGFSFRLETGVGVGRFSLRPATPADAPGNAILPAWVLQVGPRAEFLIKMGNAAFPLSIGAAYRLTQPLNAEAQTLHGLVGSLEARF